MAAVQHLAPYGDGQRSPYPSSSGLRPQRPPSHRRSGNYTRPPIGAGQRSPNGEEPQASVDITPAAGFHGRRSPSSKQPCLPMERRRGRGLAVPSTTWTTSITARLRQGRRPRKRRRGQRLLSEGTKPTTSITSTKSTSATARLTACFNGRPPLTSGRQRLPSEGTTTLPGTRHK